MCIKVCVSLIYIYICVRVCRYGQTNCWVLPTGKYGVYEMKGKQAFVMSESAALSMSLSLSLSLMCLSYCMGVVSSLSHHNQHCPKTHKHTHTHTSTHTHTYIDMSYQKLMPTRGKPHKLASITGYYYYYYYYYLV